MNAALKVNEQSGFDGLTGQGEAGHVDLRPQIVNRPQIGPDSQLNVLDEEQIGKLENEIAEKEKGVRRIPGSAIANDRHYRSVMEDFNLMSVDSPEYVHVQRSLEDYWDRRGLGHGQVAAVADVKRGRAYQLMAEMGEGTDLNADQVKDVERSLGKKGVVEFYKGLTKEEQDEVLVDGYVQSFVGGPPALSRVYLAERLGLDTDEAHVMAAELRRQAGVGRAKRERVKKDLFEVWGEMLSATGGGKEFSLDPREHQGRSAEFMAAAGQLAVSQRRAAAFVEEMAYGVDGKGPKAQGMSTGIGGLRAHGYSKYEEGRWVVELAKMHKDDPQAYEFALGAIAALVDGERGEYNWAARTASNFMGMFNEAFLGSARWTEEQMMGTLEALGVVKKGEEKFGDPFWTRRVNKVARDIQQIRMGQFEAKSGSGFLNFMEDVGSMAGGSFSFMATMGAGSLFETADTAETKYLAEGKDEGVARYAGLGEGAGMWAANIWGLGKGGKLVGNAYDKLMNWAGRKVGMGGVLGRALKTDRFWGRGPLFVGLEGGVLHAQTVIEPYVRSVASNMFTGGQGKSWDEADAEAREAMTWRNFLVALPMSTMLGYGRYAKNSPFRAAAMADERVRGIKLECAESPESMRGLHFTDSEIKEVLNAKDDRVRLRLFDLALQQKAAEKMGNAAGDPIAVLMTPDVPLVKSLMEEGLIPQAEVKDGRMRVYGAEAVTFSSSELEQGEGTENVAAGEKGGADGFVEMDLEAGSRYLATKVQDWAAKQDFTLKNAVMEDAAVEYFAERCDVDFKRNGTPMTYKALKRMADDALLRVDERKSRVDSLNKDELIAQDEDILLAVLPNNFRDRVEVALRRGEVQRAEGREGDVSDEEISDALDGSEASAMNYELAMGKRVIRYYESEAKFYDIVEELSELYVKGEMAGGRELPWFADHLIETQRAFKEQGVKNWMLIDEAMAGDRTAVVEGMSKLMQAVYMGEYEKKSLPAPVRRFLDVAAALCRKVADMLGLAGAFRKAVDSGAVKDDFASFVYDAVGADFARSRGDVVRAEFERSLNDLKEKPNRILDYYEGHVTSIDKYGVEEWKYQVENGREEVSGEKDMVSKLGEKWQKDFWDAGRDVIRMVERASLKDVKAALRFIRKDRSRDKKVHDYIRVLRVGKTSVMPGVGRVSFSIKEKLNEMAEDEGKRRVMDFVDRVIASDVRNKTLLGIVEYRVASGREIADIKAGLGVDVTGMVHEFSADGVAHALKKHAYDSEAGRGQVSLTKDDIKLVLDVLDGYDRVDFKEKGRNKSSVIYVKEYPHGEVHAVEQVIETSGRRFSKKPRLTFKTAWVKAASSGTEPGIEGVYTPQRRDVSKSGREENVKGKDEGQSDMHGGDAGFSLRDDLLGDMKKSLEMSRSDAVRGYWAHVMRRVEKEGKALDALFGKKGADFSEVRRRMAESRSIMKAAIATLPDKARVKLRAQEAFLEYLMDALESGEFGSHEKLTPAHLAQVGRKIKFHPKFFDDLVGRHMDELLASVYKRCGDVINLFVRDELFDEVKSLIASHEAVIDERTRKFKVSRLGAGATEFLRKVIKPAFHATAAGAERKVIELSNRIAAIEVALKGQKAGKIVPNADKLVIEKEKLSAALNWWMDFSAGASADVNRMLDIHEALTHFVKVSAEAWTAQLRDKVEKWKAAGKALRAELPADVDQRSMHRAEMEVTDLGVDSETGKAKRGVMMGWLDNPVRFLQRLCDGSGKKFFGEFKREFIGAVDKAQSMRADEVERVHGILKKLLGTRSERKVNEFLMDWDGAEDLGLFLAEKGVRKTRLTIDQATDLLAKRKENPWYGVDNYSQKTIDLLREEYEAWGRGENRARKWFEVEEWFDMEPAPMPKLSRDQALYVLMCMEQPNVFYSYDPDFVTPMKKRGWNEVHKTRLEEFVGDVGMALKTVLFEEYALVGDKIRPLYEDRYGVPFSKRRNYSPLHWMVAETKEDSELASIVGDDGTVAVGRSDGFLSVRSFSHQRYIDTTQGAMKLFWKHYANAVNWVCSQEVVERYKGILSDVATAQKLMVNLGGLDYRGVQVLINRLEHGGADAARELDAAEQVKNKVMNARAVSVLAGQMTSLLKQTSAVFNALHGCDLSITEWIHGMARVLSGKSVVSVKELFSSDLFQARKDGFMYSVLLGYKKQLGGRIGMLEQVAGKSMNAMGWLDAGSNAVSFAAALDHYYRQGTGQGMTKPEAIVYARDVIEEGLSTAQPVNWTQMPKMLESTKGIFSAEWFLMSETLQRSATVMHYLTRGNTRLAVRSWLIQGVAMQALGYLVNNVMRPGGDEEERRNPLNYLPGIILGPLNGVPFLGKKTDTAVDTVCDWLGLEMQNQTAVVGSQVDLTVKDLERLRNIFAADSWKDVRQQSRSVATLASLTAMLGAWRSPRGGAVTSVSLGVATLANYLKHLAGMAEKWFGEE